MAPPKTESTVADQNYSLSHQPSLIPTANPDWLTIRPADSRSPVTDRHQYQIINIMPSVASTGTGKALLCNSEQISRAGRAIARQADAGWMVASKIPTPSAKRRAGGTAPPTKSPTEEKGPPRTRAMTASQQAPTAASGSMATEEEN